MWKRSNERYWKDSTAGTILFAMNISEFYSFNKCLQNVSFSLGQAMSLWLVISTVNSICSLGS